MKHDQSSWTWVPSKQKPGVIAWFWLMVWMAAFALSVDRCISKIYGLSG